ncbi:MAG TPA: hypothetical protein VL120_03390 [Solirubrobacteraceae bacterium]|nr:hypothetical protein [Solirubrobacteraceae bacterium]
MSDPRSEALARTGGAYEVRVLEPSPPAVAEPPWFADDPAARGDVPAGREVVSPTPTGDVLWDDLAADDPELAAWCADRWLGAYRRLQPLPPAYAATRDTLHELAEGVVSPARERANGKIGLRYTRGGFGTPYFGDDEQVRVAGAELVTTGPDGERREALDLDAAAVAALADVYGFGTNVLEVLRIELADAGRVQLWPEHFDVGLDFRRASGEEVVAGMSPGDEHYAEPYVYVVGTALVVLEYPALLAAADQRAAALEFLRANV